LHDRKLQQPAGSTRRVTAAWIAGCDGSRSAVRERCGIGFPGAPYEHTFFVADTTAAGSMTPGELNVYLWRDGFHLFFPMRGANRWRVIGILPKTLRHRDGVTFDDVAPSIVAEAGVGLDFRHCDWFSTYRIQHRSAERFRDGRCFLLGDAAHIHSPMGGQGMNTGLQDAYNLAWKLAAVVKDEAGPALLDSYAAERMPVAQRLLDSTDRAFTLIVSDSWVATLLRTRVIARVAATAMKLQRMRRLAFRTLSQIGIAYRGTGLSQLLAPLPEDAPQPGDRFPWLHLRLESGGPVEDVFAKLDDERFHLLAFGQRAELPPHAGDLLRAWSVPSDPANDDVLTRAGIPRPSFYLLRPDGHVGLAGTRLDVDPIRRYLIERVGCREPLAVG
jgi:hypothetical protein